MFPPKLWLNNGAGGPGNRYRKWMKGANEKRVKTGNCADWPPLGIARSRWQVHRKNR